MTEQKNKFLINFLMYILLFLIIYAVHYSSLLLVVLFMFCLIPTTYFASTYTVNYYVLLFTILVTSLYILQFDISELYFMLAIWIISYFLAQSFMKRLSKMMIYIWLVCLINGLILLGMLFLKLKGHTINIAMLLTNKMIDHYQVALDKGVLIQSDFDKLTEQMHFTAQLVPSLFFISIAIISLLLLNITCNLLKRIKITIPRFFPLRIYNIPKIFVIIFVSVIVLNILIPSSAATLSNLLLNLICILTVICMIQGISFLFEAIYQYKLSTFFKILVVMGGIFFVNYIAILGVSDIIFKLKEKLKK